MSNMKFSRVSSSNQEASKGVQVMALALFIMLLAFFIVLNALSSFEENKVNPVMDNLTRTFSTDSSAIPSKLSSVRPDEESQDHSGEGETKPIERIKDLFRGHIANLTIKENNDTGIMMIEVPFADFSSAVLAMGISTDMIDPSEVPFLPTLVTLLQTVEDGHSYSMEVMLYVEEEPVVMRTNSPNQFASERRKISRLSQRLQEAGVPIFQMNIGMMKGLETDMLRLIFAPYVPFDAQKVRGQS